MYKHFKSHYRNEPLDLTNVKESSQAPAQESSQAPAQESSQAPAQEPETIQSPVYSPYSSPDVPYSPGVSYQLPAGSQRHLSRRQKESQHNKGELLYTIIHLSFESQNLAVKISLN